MQMHPSMLLRFVMRICAVWLLALVAALPAGCGSKKPLTPRQQVMHVMDQMGTRDFDAVVEHFDPKLQQNMNRDRLEKNWDTLLKRRGAYVKSVVGQTSREGELELVIVTCQFEKGTVRVRATLQPDGKFSSFVFIPVGGI